MDPETTTTVLIVIVIILIFIICWPTIRNKYERLTLGKDESIIHPSLGEKDLYPPKFPIEGRMPLKSKDSMSQPNGLLTGQLYTAKDRKIYAQRTAHTDESPGTVLNLYTGSTLSSCDIPDHPARRRHGLAEYSSADDSANTYGQDIADQYDDGIPENWRIPSTPINWHKPDKSDFYGPEGPTAYSDG